MALNNFKTSSQTNNTNASDDPLKDIQDNIIHQSGLKIPLSDNMRTGGNRIYPATDVDDGIASQQPSVHPGGLMSADEYSVEGDTGKNMKKSQIQIIGQQDKKDVADLKTIEHNYDSMKGTAPGAATSVNNGRQPFMSQTTLGS